MLGELLKSEADDPAAVRKLYQRVLAREANDGEVSLAVEHLKKLGNREAAFEDLLWALVNSAEFTTRR